MKEEIKATIILPICALILGIVVYQAMSIQETGSTTTPTKIIQQSEGPEQIEPKCEKVIEKQTPIENEFSGADFFFGNGSITKSNTVYYLVLENGTDKKVSRQTFNKTNIGDCI